MRWSRNTLILTGSRRRVNSFLYATFTLAVICHVGSGLGLPAQVQQAPPASPSNPKKPEATGKKLKLGPLEISGSWRLRTEGWNWFGADSGDNDYAFMHSLFRLSIGQQTEHFDWTLEAVQDAILALPANAVVGGPQGQLGLGGTYYASNGNTRNSANGFVKQACVTLKKVGPFSVQLGRFEFLDGLELIPKNELLATVARTRVSQRLIGNFGWSAVGRSLDGAHVVADWGWNDVTLVAARPTRGVYQVDGMGELDITLIYGAYSRVFTAKKYSSRVRGFAIGYLDQRDSVLKADNRPVAIRAADRSDLQIGTYGGELLQVFDVGRGNNIDLVLWAAWQSGSWANQAHRAAAFLTEAGWQAGSTFLKPWVSVGFSRGSGDNDPSDSNHGTFFQILPTPRPYARFPFWNMQNSDDTYGSVVLRPVSGLSVRSELHALRLTNANDLWYLGGGAFQPRTFGFTGRSSNGNRSLANVWDLSCDYQMNKAFGVGLYYGRAWGKSVVASIYPKNPKGQIAYLETNFRF